MKNLLVGQSGGPTAVINASLAGVIENGIKSAEIGEVFGTLNGIDGVLGDRLVSLSHFGEENIRRLKQTPSSYLGSCRRKLPEAEEDAAVYERIFGIFEKYNIGYFLYIGGNDSMDTVKKLSAYAAKKNINIGIIGVPKTIDNDLFLTDHTPGFGSAAKFIVNSVRQLSLDTGVYDMKSAVVVEIMGRNAGWLSAAAALANSEDMHPVDIICVPEAVFDRGAFVDKVRRVMDEKDTTIIAVSEGIKDEKGKYIAESESVRKSGDGFAHAALGGAGKIVEGIIAAELGIKTRSIELSTLQRCFSAIGCKTDVSEAFSAGYEAVNLALRGCTAVMAGFRRIADTPYKVEICPFDINEVANFEKKMPKSMLSPDGMYVSDEFIRYARPLISGEQELEYDNGLIRLEIRK